ncbi:unnamed protein product, partial [Musa acuminata var. zebrina]
MIAAAIDAVWNNGAACGGVHRVKCAGATNQGVPRHSHAEGPASSSPSSTTARLGVTAPSINLSQEAFFATASPDGG